VEKTLSQRKKRAIVQAAAELFLDKGYGNVSMDNIAELANVSKRTVYNHFPSKELLFSEIVLEVRNDFGFPELEYTPGGNVSADLQDYAKKILAMIRNERFLKLLRLVMGESGRFPELRIAYSDQGMKSILDTVSDYLEALGRPVQDKLLASQQYVGMIKECLFWPVLLGLIPMPTPEKDEYVIKDCVEKFIRLYDLA